MREVKMQIAGINVFQVVEVVVALVSTYVAAKIVSRVLEKLFEKTPFPEDVEKGIAKASKYAVYIIGLLAIVSVAGVDITSILVGLGAFSIAISFATSNIIQNFVSGILVIGDRAFKVGDEIKIQVFEGRVVKIGVRTTVIEDKDGNTIFIFPTLSGTAPALKKLSSFFFEM
ncbi:MAG: mechanosensitive ion channel domain-containing protein [Candidatus Bathyarchaeota archaeon]